jgi:carbonic anhydrase
MIFKKVSGRHAIFLPLLVALVLFQTACVGTDARKGHQEGTHWGYTGDTGPTYWHTLDSAYAIAKDGRAQSPVDIITGDLVPADTLKGPEIHYHPTDFGIENNGHTIELVPMDQDNYVIIDNDRYVLQQMHFHSPSEHTIDGRPFAMEAHLLHKNAEDGIAVLGVLLENGKENPTLKGTFDKLSKEKAKSFGGLTGPVNLAELLAVGEGVYRYDGSLTTPPCTEGVKWSIYAGTVELSDAQIDTFASWYTGNSRPVQQLYERKVYMAH